MILSNLLPLPLRAVQVGLVFVGGFGVDRDVCEGGSLEEVLFLPAEVEVLVFSFSFASLVPFSIASLGCT